MYVKPVEAAAPVHSTKWEVFFYADGEVVEADLLREEVPLERALRAIAMIVFNTGKLERHHGDIVRLDGSIKPARWGAPIPSCWKTQEGEPRHVSSLLLCYGEEEYGVVEVWKRPSR